MAIILRDHRKASCVFKGGCNHAPAEYRLYHEFVNRPEKPLCSMHAERIVKAMPKAVGFVRGVI